MKKYRIILSLTILIFTLFIFASCGGNVTDATDSVVVPISQTEERSLFVRKTSIKDTDDNYFREFDGWSARGLYAETDTGNAMFYYARALTLDGEQPLIKFEMPADEKFSVNSVEIRLTDVYDENTYVAVRFTQHDNGYWSAVSARSSDVFSYYGFDNRGNGQCNTNGSVFFGSNFNGTVSENDVHYPFNVGFDGNENQVFIYQSVSEKFIVADLDDESVFGENSFGGFTSDKVYLSFSFTKLNKSGAVIITEIGGLAAAAATDYKIGCDNLKLVMVDGEEMFDGAVGYNYRLPVPVEDDFLYGNSAVTATLTDGDGNAVTIDDGYQFTPEKAGDYAVKYETSDIFGNKVEKTFDFKVNESAEEIDFVFEDKTFTVGETTALPEVEISGGNGSLTSEIEYFYNDEPVTGDSIYLGDSGEITVRASATDVIGNSGEKERTYEINDAQVIEIASPVSRYAASGTRFILPDFTAYDFVNDREMEKSIYVNGVIADGGVYNVTENGGETLTVCYYGDKGEETEVKKEFSVNVISPAKNTDISTYFIYDENEFDAVTTTNEVSFTSLRSAEKAVIAYPFALSANMAEITLNFSSMSRFDYLRIVLEDMEKDSKLYFDVFFNGDNYLIRYPYKGGFGEIVATDRMKNINTFTVVFDGEKNSIADYQNNDIFSFEHDAQGNVFEGFTAKAFYLSFEFINLRANASIGVMTLSNQSFNSVMYEFGDYTRPVITYDEPLNISNLAYGDTLTIPAATGYDVLSQNTYPVYFTLKQAGETLYDGELLDESFSVPLDKYGLYVLSFTCTDGKGISEKTETMFRIDDTVAPVVSFKDGMKTQASVNKPFVFTDFDVSDNYSDAADIEKYIVINIGQDGFVAINPGDEYTFTEKGSYNCVYYAVDANGNIGVGEFVVNVG